MFLSFSTKFSDGKPTDFVGKILSGYVAHNLGGSGSKSLDWIVSLQKSVDEAHSRGLIPLARVNGLTGSPTLKSVSESYGQKIHTIRANVDRWHTDLEIQPVINNRTKNVYQFAPNTPFVGSQSVVMRLSEPVRDEQTFIDKLSIVVDGYELGPILRREFIANDGLDWLHFGAWFFGYFTGHGLYTIQSGEFEGGVIHWTNYVYGSNLKYKSRKDAP